MTESDDRYDRRPISRRRLLAATAAVPAAVAIAACRAADRSARPAPTRDPSARRVTQLAAAELRTDGAGVRLRRSIGSNALPGLDPFLMLDEIRSNDPEEFMVGFPTHPHRGFETVTYVLDGSIEHRDSLGNRGLLGPGSTQWMTAGHGIVHSEMPQATPSIHGLQLWVNLPRAHKMVAPRYQDLQAGTIPELEVQDSVVRLVAGELEGRRGPIDGIVTAPHFVDVRLPRRGRYSHPLPATHTAFAYVLEGEVRFGDDRTRVAQHSLAVLGEGEAVVARSEEASRFLLLAAAPIREPVARWGPFVMNTEAEIRQAIEDYRTGRLTQL